MQYKDKVYWKNNLPKTKDGAYAINLDEYKSIGNDWIALYVNSNNVTLFDSSGGEHIPKKKKKFIGNSFWTWSRYVDTFFIGFIDFMVKGKSLLDYTNLFSPNEYEKNDKMIPESFK